ncbi:MAG: hypothetical protein HRU09_20005 [Oligoflexales bacterium]|nr:hypothetical protein [Oligoflexales bacterium]
MNNKLLRSLLLISICLLTNFSYAASDRQKETKAQEITNTNEELRLLLDNMGNLFELGFPVPGKILELKLESIEDEELAQYLEKIILHTGGGANHEDTARFAQDEFKKTLGGLDQFQKHEHILNLCLQVVSKNMEFPYRISGNDFFALIKHLFDQTHHPRLKLIIDQLIKEEQVIRKIAEVEEGDLRDKAIRENFPENRKKGAKELLNEIMILNALFASLD